MSRTLSFLRRRLLRRARPAQSGRMAGMSGAFVVLAAVIGCGAIAAVPAQRAQQSVDQLRWLIGCWSMTTPRGLVITETWSQPARDTLAGSGRTERGGTVVSTEVMRVFARSDTLVYAAMPSGQAYTEFRAIELEAGTVVFENPEHDFPQRVGYTLGAAGDSLHARIEGVTDSGRRSASFPMARVACAVR
jgi:hypothetical protein